MNGTATFGGKTVVLQRSIALIHGISGVQKSL
jgi:hypothetical protein